MGLVRHVQGVPLVLVIPLEGVVVLVKWCQPRQIRCLEKAWRKRMIIFVQPVLNIVIVNQGSVLDPWPLVQEVHQTINTIPEPDPGLKMMTNAIILAIMGAMAVGSNTPRGVGYPPTGVECIVGLAMTAMKASMVVAEVIIMAAAAGYPGGLECIVGLAMTAMTTGRI